MENSIFDSSFSEEDFESDDELIKGNREYKDTLFCFLFGNEKYKELTLSLYNAVNSTNYDDPSLISIRTLRDVIFVSIRNDVSFLIEGTFNFYEHQSTFNPNMPARMFIYAARAYNKYIYENKMNIYKDSKLTLPVPKLVCFYNGDKNQPDRTLLSLTDLLGENADPSESDIQINVHMFNINFDRNRELLDKCRALLDYSMFVQGVRNFIIKHELTYEDNLAPAIIYALDHLPEESVIKPILLSNKSEVIDMCITEYTREKELYFHKREVEEAHENGRKEGIEEGIAENQISTAKNLLLNGISDEVILNCTGISSDLLNDIKKTMN